MGGKDGERGAERERGLKSQIENTWEERNFKGGVDGGGWIQIAD